MDEQNERNELISVSLDRLYDGMPVTHDIYNSDRTLLLISEGTILTQSKIEAIERHNGGKIINVHAETYIKILEHKLSCKIVKRESIEEETGYSAVKEQAEEMIDAFRDTDEVPKEKLHSISVELSHKLENTRQDLILDLINALGPVDEYLQRHCVDVAMLNGLMGKWLNLPKEDVDRLVLAGLLHDCGKAALPAQVLSAPRGLTGAEFEVVKMHSVYSYDKLGEFTPEVRYAARYHHERLDGGGYPDGCAGGGIPLEARVTAVSDIYDAMVSRRSYKAPHSPFYILKMLMDMSGTDLDPLIIKAFVDNMLNELRGKPALLSDGEVGVIYEIDPDDIEHPYVRTCSGTIKTNDKMLCTNMFFDDEEYTPIFT